MLECKHSADPGYLLGGYHEAILYRWEYAPELTRWPRSTLVSSSPLPGATRADDDVIAVGWPEWPPEVVTEALVGVAVGAN